MPPEAAPRPRLLTLAVEGVLPVLAGCAGALAGGPEAGVVGGVVGVAVGQGVEKAINFFGGRIVQRWAEWFRKQPPAERDRALAELAAITPEQARKEAEDLLDKLVLEPINKADRELAVNYLTLLPGAVDRALTRATPGGVRSLPPGISTEEPQQLLSVMPTTLPPYAVGAEVPGTPYRLDALLGTGGFGAVYRASTKSLQHLPLAIKFCLDSAMVEALHRERNNLERLMKAGGEDWSPRVVRLYGYDLEHETPYLVYEYVTGGDLIRYLAQKRDKLDRALNADEVLEIIVQVTEALVFAHDHGLVHRDLKPANVLVEGGVIKLADFGLGGVTSERAAQVSRIGATTVNMLSLADQASLFRGAGTPLYMSPEQRRGQAPDPRHDLYSLGVMWYQLLVGDVSRELHPGWAKELTNRYQVPRSHINLIDSCIGWFEERPRNAGELLRSMRELTTGTQVPAPPVTPPTATPTPAVPIASSEELRQDLLANQVRALVDAHRATFEVKSQYQNIFMWGGGLWFALAMILTSERFGFPVAVLIGGFCGGVLSWIIYQFTLYRQKANQDKLTEQIAVLSREFPTVVLGWGGEIVLKDRRIVENLARKMGLEIDPPVEEEPQTPEPSTTASPHRADTKIPAPGKTMLAPGKPLSLPPERGQDAVEQLRVLREEQNRLAKFTPRHSFPWQVALFLGVLLAVPLGIGMGTYIHSLIAPVWVQVYSPSEGTVTQYYRPMHASVLSDSALVRVQREANVAAIGAGVGTSLLVAILVCVFLSRWTWHRRQLVLGLILGISMGALVGGGVGMLIHELASPYVVSPKYYGQPHEYYYSTGQKTDEAGYVRERTQVNSHSAIAGVGVGILTALALMLTVQFLYRRKVWIARQEVETLAKRTSETFPELATAAGGVEGLSIPGSAQLLLRQLGAS